MTVPNDLRFKLEQAYLELPDKTNKPIKEFKIKIVSHCLTDAPYNKGRNMNEVQYKELLNQVSLYCTKENIDYTIITIPTDYSMSVEDCIGLIDIADIYIGGDTGFTHCAAALDKDIVAIYGNNEHDVKAFEPEKIKGGFKYDWSSDPLTNKYRKFELKNNLFNIEEVLFYVIDKIKEKNKNG
jgi:ADP-heptose:LPS heptosyltransferase